MASSARQICTQCGVDYDSAIHRQCKCAEEDDWYLMLLLQMHTLDVAFRPCKPYAREESASRLAALDTPLADLADLEDPEEFDEAELEDFFDPFGGDTEHDHDTEEWENGD